MYGKKVNEYMCVRFNSIYIFLRNRRFEKVQKKFKLNTHCVLKPWDGSWFASFLFSMPKIIVMLTFLSRWREAVLCLFSYTPFDSRLPMTGH